MGLGIDITSQHLTLLLLELDTGENATLELYASDTGLYPSSLDIHRHVPFPFKGPNWVWAKGVNGHWGWVLISQANI